MIRVVALNTKTGNTGQADFETQELADAWIQQQISEQTYGRGEVTMTSFDAGLAGLDIADATPAGLNEESKELYKFSEEFQFTKTDVSAEYEEADALKGVYTDEAKGKAIGSEISLLLRKKLAIGEISMEQLVEFVERADVIKVERYLDKGYLTLVQPLIESKDFTPLTAEERQYFLAKIKS